MDAERLDRIQDVFLAALDLAPEARTAYLDETCRDDADLRRSVERYLRADDDAAEGFLEAAAAVVAEGLPSSGGTDEDGEIGPYRILRPLGQGGMGRVYLAVREEPYRRYVALKVILQGVHSPTAHARFRAERQILASLDHPAIARLYDGGLADDGRPYFAMEYVAGEPITTFCDHHRLAIDERLDLFQRVCEAVQFAHQHLVVHRDLKPSNILVTVGEDGRPMPKLLDFGIAKVLADSEVDADEGFALTHTGGRVMTPEYAAPEQVRGDPVTTATDVYALGLLLYRLLTGRPPYALPNRLSDLDRAITDATPKHPSAAVRQDVEAGDRAAADRSTTTEHLHRRLRGDLDVICLKALAKEPERRYQSAEQLRDDLRRHQAGLPIEAHAPTPAYRVRKFVERHRVGVAALLLAAIGLLGGLGAALWQAQRAADAAARAEAEAATAEEVKDYLVSVFGASNPWQRPGGGELTARELLASGVEQVEALEGEPEVQAELLDALGNVYGSIGLFDEAESLLKRALVVRRTLRGDEHEEVAESLMSLAGLYLNKGAYDDAEALYREALAMRRRLLPSPHIDLADALNDLGVLLNSRDAHEEAEPLLREALAIQRQLSDEERLSVSITIANLAGVLRDQENYTEAEQLLREALAMQRRLLDPVHPNVAASLSTLALIKRDQGAYNEAEPLLREALAMRQQLFGEAHDLTAGTRYQLARLLMTNGRPEEAEPLFREALRVSEETNGAEHWKTAFARIGLGRALTARQSYQEAERLLDEAHAFFRRPDAGGPPSGPSRAREALAELYVAWGKPERADALEALTEADNVP